MNTSAAPMQRRNSFKIDLSIFFALWLYTVFIVELTQAFTVIKPTIVAYVMACGDDGKIVDMTRPPQINTEPSRMSLPIETVVRSGSGVLLELHSGKALNSW